MEPGIELTLNVFLDVRRYEGLINLYELRGAKANTKRNHMKSFITVGTVEWFHVYLISVAPSVRQIHEDVEGIQR